jgi:hypothetical protein
MFYTPKSYFEILAFTSGSMISPSVIFIDGIVSKKLFVSIENNVGSITKMISSFFFYDTILIIVT